MGGRLPCRPKVAHRAAGKCANWGYREFLSVPEDQSPLKKRRKSGRAAWSNGKSAILIELQHGFRQFRSTCLAEISGFARLRPCRRLQFPAGRLYRIRTAAVLRTFERAPK